MAYNVPHTKQHTEDKNMAHLTQEDKKELAPGIKAVLKKYGMKGSISVDHHSTLVVTLKSGKIDIFGAYNEGRDHKLDMTHFAVNPYYITEHFAGIAGQFLTELKESMNVGNYDRSDVMSDYFDVGWYCEIQVGRWNGSYIYNPEVVTA
jgi:hypothetical protein